MTKTMMLNCPTRGQRGEMKAISKMARSHTGGCLIDAAFLICLILSFFNPLLWILTIPLFVMALTWGFKRNKFWKCKNCGALLPRD